MVSTSSGEFSGRVEDAPAAKPVELRLMRADEASEVSDLVLRTFGEDVARDCDPQGMEAFGRYAVPGALLQRSEHGHIVVVAMVQAQIVGAFSNVYTCELEIDRIESEVIDSSCDCPHTCDCQHIACFIFYLEEELEKLLAGYSQEAKRKNVQIDPVVEHIEKKVEIKEKLKMKKVIIDEYVSSAALLGTSPFFVPPEEYNKDSGELSFLFDRGEGAQKGVEVSLVLRLPFRSKPFYISQPKNFFLSVASQEPITLGGRKCVFGTDSFGPFCEELIKIMRVHLYFLETKGAKGIVRTAEMDEEG